MITFLRTHFPQSRSKWRMYAKALVPMMLASSLFALNGFIDNFMVGHINGGTDGLFAVNTWTGIGMGIFMGISTAGAMVQAQFYFGGRKDKAREMARLRFLLSIASSSIMTLMIWSIPNQMLSVFLGSNPSAIAVENAKLYAKIITIQWMLMSLTYNLGNQLREIGHAKITMIWGIGTLITNASLNSILMFGFHFGVDGAAWASVAARLVALCVGVWYYIHKKIEIGFNPLTLFKTSKLIWKEFFKRWAMFFSAATVIFLINFRNHFYMAAYPSTEDPNASLIGVGINAGTVLGLTGAITQIFTTTFNALASMSSMFVGSELGKNNIEQAKKNANELKGFNTLIASSFSILIVIFGFIVPYMSFLFTSEYKIDKVTGDYILDALGNKILIRDGHANLLNVKTSLFVIAFYYPIWIWFSTSYRNALAGGKGRLFIWTDWAVAALQIGWLAILVVIRDNSPMVQTHFWMFYGMFFLSDLLKLLFQEIWYYKTKWAYSITKEFAEVEKAEAEDRVRSRSRD